MARVTLIRPYRISDGDRSERLEPQEQILLLALMGRPTCTKDLLSEILWPDPDFMPDHWVSLIRLRVHTLRRKINRFGWTISVRYYHGWTLEPVT